MATPQRSASEVVRAVKLSAIYAQLTGQEPRAFGAQHRVPATWRDGENRSVSINDEKGTWYDHATQEQGGVLDLVTRVNGGTRQDALRWVSEFAGVPLNAASPAVLADMRQTTRETERDMPDARLWRRSAIGLGEELLGTLKESLWNADATTQAQPGEIATLTRRVANWRTLDGAALVAEYRSWKVSDPDTTEIMVRSARLQEAQDARQLALEHISARNRTHAEQREYRALMDTHGYPTPVTEKYTTRDMPQLVVMGATDWIIEEALIMNEQRDLKPAPELSNAQIVAEDRQLHERYEALKERLQQAPPSQREEIREEMAPIVNREKELRVEYGTRVQTERVVDRVPKQDIGYGR